MDRGLYRHFTIMEGGLFNKSVRTSIGSPKSGCQSLSFKIIVKDNPSKHILSFPCLRAYLSYCNKKRNILQVSYRYIIRIRNNDFRYKRVITVTCFFMPIGEIGNGQLFLVRLRINFPLGRCEMLRCGSSSPLSKV